MDASGTLLSEQRYLPFGGVRGDVGTLITETDYRYTGQREEAELGLYYYVARWYNPALGRFTQADTIVPNPGSAKAYDRYAYVYNNPMKYVDPSGHQGDTPCTISGNCVEEWENEDGDGGGDGDGDGSQPDVIDEEVPKIVFCGMYIGSPGEKGPPCEIQMFMWVEDIPEDFRIQYQEGGKYATMQFALIKGLPSHIVLICYSGGADACLMFAEAYEGKIETLVLLGPALDGEWKDGSGRSLDSINPETGKPEWMTIVDKLILGGTDVLIVDDSMKAGGYVQPATNDPKAGRYERWTPAQTGLIHHDETFDGMGTNNNYYFRYNWVYPWIRGE